MPRAAFFQLNAAYFGRAFDDGIVRALLTRGYEVDLYAPDGERPQHRYDSGVRRLAVDYRRAWLLRNLRLAYQYDLFIGTIDVPMAFAGVLAALGRKPSIVAADELYIGGYEGNAFLYWNAITRWAMRRADLTIITDRLRIPLHRQYARASSEQQFVGYPCCYAEPYGGRTRAEARRMLGIADDDFVLSCTGAFSEHNGAHWIIRLLDRSDARLRVLVQPGGRPAAMTDALLEHLQSEGRVIYRPNRVEWTEAPQITMAADASCVFYLSPKPDFQNLGASSTKLCTSLWIGVPVIATKQPSFAPIDELRCGVTFEGESELDDAIAHMRRDRELYAANTARAVREWLRPEESFRELESALDAIL
jgi:glycosyltransferase involved in cell wall biosynthesis